MLGQPHGQSLVAGDVLQNAPDTGIAAPISAGYCVNQLERVH
jgi:hypothetical protein